MIRILILLGLALTTQITGAQEDIRTIDVLHMMNGEKMKGKITMYEPGNDIEFRDLDGREMTFPEYQIKKIGKKNLKPIRLKERVSLPEKGLYHTYQVAMLTNTIGAESGGLRGAELSGSIGYRFRRDNEVGIGTGIDFYHTRAGEMVVPIFVEVNRALMKQPVTPILGIRAGYGIGVVNRDQGIGQAGGGYMVNPTFGWRLSGTDAMNMSIVLGVKFQRASFTYLRSSDEFSEVDITYKRLQIGLKMQF